MEVADPHAPVRVLLVTYYFPPDLSAGSFRAEALVDALLNNGQNVHLDVITTEPNRYPSHRPLIDKNESKTYTVRRISMPKAASGLLGQVWCFAEFARKAYDSIPSEHYDVVVATSSRLMTACLGARIAKKVGAKLYLDIRDIFVETINDIFPSFFFKPMNFIFSRMERWVIGRAARINLVSPGFVPYFQQRYGYQEYRCFTNGVDESFLEFTPPPSDRLPIAGTKRKLNVIYAGNIGDGQGLDEIIPALALRIRDVATFTIVGDGETRQKLVNDCQQLGAPVKFLKAVPRNELIEIYMSADILFLHLNNLPAFNRVLPSKLFEYAATGKPIWAGVTGYPREFVLKNIKGAAVFDPCDINQAVRAFESLELANFDRGMFIENFSRQKIMKEMASDVLSLVAGD